MKPYRPRAWLFSTTLFPSGRRKVVFSSFSTMASPINLKAPNGVEWSQPTGLFINNEFVASSKADSRIVSIDPATEQEIATVHAATADDVDLAVNAAKKAFHADSWKKLPGTDRGILMARLADLIEQKKELFATIDAWDNGNTSLSNVFRTKFDRGIRKAIY